MNIALRSRLVPVSGGTRARGRQAGLVDRIARDGRFDANEHALIDYLRANARAIDPALPDLVAQLETRKAASVEAVAFVGKNGQARAASESDRR